MHSERFQDGFDDSIRGELPCRCRPHRLAVHRLCLAECLKIGGQRPLVVLFGHALAAGREAIDEVAGQSVLDERGPGADADGDKKACHRRHIAAAV